jgi:chloramphenicol O-acetyltransferase type A
MDYKIVAVDEYYRSGVFRHFSEDCRCSVSITSRVDVTELADCSKHRNKKFYIDFLYILSKTMNAREDYRLSYLRDTQQLVVYDKINPTQYIFHADTETCTPVYTEYLPEYQSFYENCAIDIEKAKQTREYKLDMLHHETWFDASYISWLSYDALHVELPDGYLYFMPIINWGRYREENGRLMMPVSVRLNHAAADGYLLAQVFVLLQKEIACFVRDENAG